VLALYQTRAGGFTSEDLKLLSACREDFVRLMELRQETSARLDQGVVHAIAARKDREIAIAH